MEAGIIVAIGERGAIGRKGDLIWHIPEDLKHFKSLTIGHPIIMGRKTWDSLPRKPLPGRRNIIVTRSKDFAAEGAEIAHSPEEALQMTQNENPFIIGGGEIYRKMMPLASSLHLTQIKADAPDADTFLEINPNDWEVVETEGPYFTPEGIEYSYVTLKRHK